MTLRRPLHDMRLASSLMMLAVIAAVALKALFPAGFMPAFDQDGFAQIVICSGMEQKTITVPVEKEPAPAHRDAAKELCAYQLLAAAKLLLSAPPAITLPAFAGTRIQGDRLDDAAPGRIFPVSYAPRGPPSV